MGTLLTCSAIRPQKGKFSSLTFHRGRKALCVNSFYSCMSMEVEKDGLTLSPSTMHQQCQQAARGGRGRAYGGCGEN